MPKKSKEKKVLHVAKAWRNYGTKTKDSGHVIERREQMVFIERDDVDGHCQGAWHDQEHRYWAGVASSGRAECRKCGAKIAKDALRIGTPRVRPAFNRDSQLATVALSLSLTRAAAAAPAAFCRRRRRCRAAWRATSRTGTTWSAAASRACPRRS